jgi:5-methylcytosine-specific restriction endonuclease McrA
MPRCTFGAPGSPNPLDGHGIMKVLKPQWNRLTRGRIGRTISAPVLRSVVASAPTAVPRRAGFVMSSRALMNKKCKYCKRPFHVPPSLRSQRFCSKRCRSDYEFGPPELIRQCSKCKNEYPATPEFYRVSARRRQGLSSECVFCLRTRAIDYNKRKPEKRQLGVINYKRNHSERIKELKHASYLRHRDAVIAAARLYRKRNPGCLRHDPYKSRAKWARLRALRKSRVQASSAHYTRDDVVRQLAQQNNACYYCGVDLQATVFEVDHYIPLSKGGSNGPDNIVIACRFCNRSKNNRDPEVFIAELAARSR